MRFIISFMLLACAWGLADSFSLNVNNDAFETQYRLDMTPYVSSSSETTYSFYGRLLRNDETLFCAGWEIAGTLESAESIHIAAGLEAAFADHYAAVPLFLSLGYTLPVDEPVPQTTLFARLAYAPSVLSFRDAKEYRSYRFEADMQIIRHFHLYGGYRNIKTHYKYIDATFDDGWYGGIRFTF